MDENILFASHKHMLYVQYRIYFPFAANTVQVINSLYEVCEHANDFTKHHGHQTAWPRLPFSSHHTVGGVEGEQHLQVP